MVEAYRTCPRRGRRLLRVALTALLACAIPARATEPTSKYRLPPIDDVLERLDQTSRLYLDNALRFTCDETIVHHMGNGRRSFRFNYIYAYSEDQGLRDHRLTRRGWRKVETGTGKVKTPREVRLTEYGLPTWMSRAYNWIFIFETARWNLYDYDVLGREQRMGRPALKIRFEPKAPLIDRINDWVGTAWVDAETYQMLHVDAQRLVDYESRQQLDRDLAEAREWKRQRKASHSIFTVSTSYAVERDGMRFPSQVELATTRYVVRGGKRLPRYYEYPGWRVSQSYDNYRLFGIETQGRIGKYFDRRR